MQKEYEAKLSDMTFNSLLDTAITAAKVKMQHSLREILILRL